MATTKIATCCYCGTRAALVLRGDVRHELSCASCGAPLHNMKHLKAEAARPGRPDFKADTKATRKKARPAQTADRKVGQKPRKKKSKGLAHRFFDEAFDLLDDIFD
ncbi:hypothetical protein ANTHELSMS3_04362 [Antarctobacter heliothermus]|uniref:Uncharacterized protein n=2 Tax=Antarctobacter heliothermus TaxID=74033 RepID=A0A222E9S1_9RHOB|nr:hypothetical protein ANTHELSMS3_04362 [Antarctobacter heliothermus]